MNRSIALKAIENLLYYLGEDPSREGLKETPERVLRGYGEMLRGYNQDPKNLLKTFVVDACSEMVVLREISVVSLCEHHILPFSGIAHIGYIPNGRVIGVSKLARLLEVYSRRLQVQERLTTQVTTALDEVLDPLGSACVIEATHSCMSCRGVKQSSAVMVTSSLTREFLKPAVRDEFLRLIGK